jgi:DNA-damage-inducible protein J
MSQAMVNFRMDEQLKKNMEATCKELGLSMSAAFTIFASKVAREKRIPFDVAIDPFYSEKNIKELEERIHAIESGTAKFVSHPLIES